MNLHLFIICALTILSVSGAASIDVDLAPKTEPTEKSFGDLFSEELRESFIKAFDIDHKEFKDTLLKYCSTGKRNKLLTQEEIDVYNYVKRGFCSFEKDHNYRSCNLRGFWKGFTISFFEEEDKTIKDLLAAMGFLSEEISSGRDLSKLNIADIIRNGVSKLFNKTELKTLDLWAISSVDGEPYRFRSFSAFIVLLSILYDFNTNKILKKRYGEVLSKELSVSSKIILESENKRHGHNLRKRSRLGKDTNPVGNKSNKKRRNGIHIKKLQKESKQEEFIRVRSPVQSSMKKQVDNRISIKENAEKQVRVENQPVIKVEKDDDVFDFYREFFARDELLDANLYYKYYENIEPAYFPWEKGFEIDLFDNFNNQNPCRPPN